VDTPPRATPAPPGLLARLRRSGLLAALAVGVAAWGVGRLVQTQVQAGRAEELRALVQPGELRMISSLSCIFCTRARQYLVEHRIPVEECFIERDPACRAEYTRLGAAGTPTVLVRGQPQLGFDPARIARTLGGRD
jgi:glutaredoxin